MPEDNDQFSSGNPPEGKPRPTVIKPSDADHVRKPTVIGSGQKPATVAPATAAPKPTSIGAGQSVPPVASQLPKVPTRIASTPPLPVSPVIEKVMQRGPTQIPGVQRKRLAVTIADLTATNPASSEDALRRSLEILLETNLDEATDRTIVLWGHDLQKRYGQLVSECVTLSESEAITKTNRDIARVLEILESIDLQKIFGSSDGLVSKFLSKRSSKVDSLDELEKVRVELQQLLDLFNQRLDALLDLRVRLDETSSSISKIGVEVEAAAIAAVYLGEYLGDKHPDKVSSAQRFADRAMSLTQTLIQIKGSNSLLLQQVEQPLVLIKAVQDVALVMLPGFLSTIVGFKTMAQGNRKPTATSVAELNDQLGHIVRKLGGR